MITENLNYSTPIDEYSFSAGVSEMINGGTTSYADIGIQLECAKRELFEEIGYIPALILPLNIPHEIYTENEDDEGERSPPHLQEKLREIIFHSSF